MNAKHAFQVATISLLALCRPIRSIEYPCLQSSLRSIWLDTFQSIGRCGMVSLNLHRDSVKESVDGGNTCFNADREKPAKKSSGEIDGCLVKCECQPLNICRGPSQCRDEEANIGLVGACEMFLQICIVPALHFARSRTSWTLQPNNCISSMQLNLFEPRRWVWTLSFKTPK